MIKSLFGLTKEPFNRNELSWLPQQKQIFGIIKIHSQQGGFSVITGNPGAGKRVLREYIESLQKERDTTVVSCSRTRHTYLHILKQLAGPFKIEMPVKDLEKERINHAFNHIRDGKILYLLIDEAYLLARQVLRKLRLLFERFPKKHKLILSGQRDLFYSRSLNVNQDIKSRITYSGNIAPLHDDDLERYIIKELEAVRRGINIFDRAAIELILRSAQDHLRLCRNLCYGRLIEACRETKKGSLSATSTMSWCKRMGVLMKRWASNKWHKEITRRMKLTPLRSGWDADDAYLIISFLDELKAVLWETYGSGIIEQQQKERNAINHDARPLPLKID